jgi:hypothetical protein
MGKFGRNAVSNDGARRLQSMYGGVILVGSDIAAGNKLGKMACKCKPLSTFKEGGGSG